MIRFLPLAIFLAFAAILGWAMLAAAPQHFLGLSIGTPAPALYATPLNAGRKTRIPLPPEPLLVHFFASWCTPCIAEMATLNELHARGVPIIGIAWNDDPEKLRRFLQKHGNPFLAVYQDTTGESANAFRIRGVPESITVDAQGTVRAHWQGPVESREVLKILQKNNRP